MRLTDAIICDDIRDEIAGKKTLVGVYSDDMTISASGPIPWPIVIRLCFHLRFARDAAEKWPGSGSKLQVTINHRGKPMVELELEPAYDPKSRYASLSLRLEQAKIPGPGEITVEALVRPKKGEAAALVAPVPFRVIVVETAASN